MVGLLNIGVEEVKGVEAVREGRNALLREVRSAICSMKASLWKRSDVRQRGKVDVDCHRRIFSGNIALKTAEGTAQADRGRICASRDEPLD